VIVDFPLLVVVRSQERMYKNDEGRHLRSTPLLRQSPGTERYF
jgi:hypothetical protein